MPRHPPCALTILTVKSPFSTFEITTEVLISRCRWNTSPAYRIGDVRDYLCSFQRSLRRLSRGSHTTVSQNSTACIRPESSSPLAMIKTRLVRVAGQVQSTFQAIRAWSTGPLVEDEVLRASIDAFPYRLLRMRSFPRKEVIQPQLPLRLPCYDFTPVTSPTFDGCLPKGLAHRLRVLLTPVV